MLAVTADNASANDVMIDELQELIDSFRGRAAHVRCFNPVINLVVKTLLHQFDAEHKKKNADHTALDEAEAALHELLSRDDIDEDNDDVDEWDMDNVEGWVNEREEMSKGEIVELEKTTRPVKFMLMKVSSVPCK